MLGLPLLLYLCHWSPSPLNPTPRTTKAFSSLALGPTGSLNVDLCSKPTGVELELEAALSLKVHPQQQWMLLLPGGRGAVGL